VRWPLQLARFGRGGSRGQSPIWRQGSPHKAEWASLPSMSLRIAAPPLTAAFSAFAEGLATARGDQLLHANEHLRVVQLPAPILQPSHMLAELAGEWAEGVTGRQAPMPTPRRVAKARLASTVSAAAVQEVFSTATVAGEVLAGAPGPLTIATVGSWSEVPFHPRPPTGDPEARPAGDVVPGREMVRPGPISRASRPRRLGLGPPLQRRPETRTAERTEVASTSPLGPGTDSAEPTRSHREWSVAGHVRPTASINPGITTAVGESGGTAADVALEPTPQPLPIQREHMRPRSTGVDQRLRADEGARVPARSLSAPAVRPASEPAPGQQTGRPALENRSDVETEADTQAVPVAIRAPIEHRLGFDLSSVRVHRGSESSALSRSLQASAFTIGDDIHLPSSQGPLEAHPARALLGHELAHVAQQRRLGGHMPAESSPAGQQLEDAAREAEAWPQLIEAPRSSLPDGETPMARSATRTAGLAIATGQGRSAPDGSLIFQPPPPMSASAPSPPVAVSSIQRAPLSAPSLKTSGSITESDLENLAGKLYGRIRSRLRSELLVDRERAGLVTDVR